MNICVDTRHFFMISWKCLRVDLHWVYISEMGPVYLIKSYIFYPLMFPCFTNRSCPHITKSLGSFPPFCVIEFDPMTGKSLEEIVRSIFVCWDALMHEGVQTLLSCDTVCDQKPTLDLTQRLLLFALFLLKNDLNILFGDLVDLSFLLNLCTLNINREYQIPKISL